MKDLTNQPDQHELSIKEKLMKTFEEMGFTLEACPDSDGYYLFHYEGLSFLWLYNDDDEQFFNLSLPAARARRMHECACYAGTDIAEYLF